MDQLIYEIAGTKYLLFNIPITGNTDQKKIQSAVKKHNGIMQGVGEIKRGFFMGGYAVLNILIPEQNVLAFNSEET